MAITRKPTAPAVDVDALIAKGLSVQPVEAQEAKPKEVNVAMRIPSDIAAKMDTAIKARPVRIPRHSWILEAILEKAEREDSRRG